MSAGICKLIHSQNRYISCLLKFMGLKSFCFNENYLAIFKSKLLKFFYSIKVLYGGIHADVARFSRLSDQMLIFSIETKTWAELGKKSFLLPIDLKKSRIS